MPSKKVTRAILYVRRSTSQQTGSLKQQVEWAVKRAAELHVSLDTSLSALKKACSSHKSVAGDLCLDDAISGSDMNRPGFKACIDRLRTDKTITHLFCWQRDRLARPDSPLHLAALEMDIRRTGISIVTSAGVLPRLSRSESDVGGEIQSLLEYHRARDDVRGLSQKVLRGLKKTAEKGYSTGGSASYGFVRVLVRESDLHVDRVLRDKERVRQPGYSVAEMPGKDKASRQKQHVVARIAAEYYKGLGGLAAIAKRLNKDGIPPPGANRKNSKGLWTLSSVRTIIENPIYSGLAAYGRVAEGKIHRLSIKGADPFRELRDDEIAPDNKDEVKKIHHRDTADWILVPAPVKFDPIVPEEVWSANYETLLSRGKKLGTRGIPRCSDPNRYPLRVICGDCGRPMIGSLYQNKLCYICASYESTNAQECHHNWVERDVLVLFTIQSLREWLGKLGRKKKLEQAIRVLIEADKPAADAEASLKALKAELASTQRKAELAHVDKIEAADKLERDIADKTYREFLSEVRALERKIAKLETKRQPKSLPKEVQRAASVMNELHLFFKKMRENRLRETFNALGIELVVHFDHPSTGRRRNVPVGGELRLGVNGEVKLPKGVVNKSAPKKNAPSTKGRMSGKVGRGDWT